MTGEGRVVFLIGGANAFAGSSPEFPCSRIKMCILFCWNRLRMAGRQITQRFPKISFLHKVAESLSVYEEGPMMSIVLLVLKMITLHFL